MALRLEIVFEKPSANHWLKLQAAYDLCQIRQNKSDVHVQPYKIKYAWNVNIWNFFFYQ